jgi:hypothetical protein
MATRPPLSCLIGFVLIAASAACGDLTHAPTGPSQTLALEVTVSGTVHDTSDRPIQAATVIASVEGLSRLKRTAETDHDGRFELRVPIPLSPVTVSLSISAVGFRAPAWETTHFPGVEMTPTIRMQPDLTVSVGEALSSVVLPDDPVWNVGDGRRCGPCQKVAIGTPSAAGARVVSVTWTGESDPHLLLSGLDAHYETFVAVGEHRSHKRVEATIPAMSSAWAYIGTAGDSLSEPIPYEISVRWADSTRGDQ